MIHDSCSVQGPNRPLLVMNLGGDGLMGVARPDCPQYVRYCSDLSSLQNNTGIIPCRPFWSSGHPEAHDWMRCSGPSRRALRLWDACVRSHGIATSNKKLLGSTTWGWGCVFGDILSDHARASGFAYDVSCCRSIAAGTYNTSFLPLLLGWEGLGCEHIVFKLEVHQCIRFPIDGTPFIKEERCEGPCCSVFLCVFLLYLGMLHKGYEVCSETAGLAAHVPASRTT